MIYTVKYSEHTNQDINRAVDYLMDILKSPQAAYRLRLEAQSSIANLKTFPCKHPIIQDLFLSFYEIRYIQIKNHLAFYKVIEETKTIYVIRFLYARSDWKRILHKTILYDEYISENTGGYVHEEQEEYGKQLKKEHNNMPETQNTNIDNENFDEEKARKELFNELQKGLDDIKAGRTVPAEEVFAMLREELEK